MAKIELEDNSFAAREKLNSERERDRDRREDRDRDREPIEKVISGNVKRKKKTLGRKVVDFVVGGDMDKINDYVKYDVIGPGIKNLIYDIFISSLSMAFFGEVRRGSSRDREGSARSRRTSYDRMYDDRRDMGRRRSSRPSYDIDDIIFDTRDDAELALDRLERILDQYGTVRVADLNSVAGITGSWTDKNFGWTDLRGVRVLPVPEGYIIDFPPCEDVR